MKLNTIETKFTSEFQELFVYLFLLLKSLIPLKCYQLL